LPSPEAPALRVLIAESDEALARIIERGLRAHGFDVLSASDPRHVLELSADGSVRLVLLDLASSESVYDAVRAARPDLPVLRLGTYDDGVASEDGWLRKPFAFEELIARIRALTRRPNERRATTLRAGDLRIDLLARCAWRGDRAIDLPDREFALLEYFVRHPDRVLSRRAILSDVWGYHFDTSSNVVDVYVRYLRNKVDRPGEPSLIASVRGAGYRFDTPPAASRTDLATAKA
jgi:DNA-binding response OmpR family regulator